MRHILYATTALATAGLIAGAAGNAVAQTAPATTTRPATPPAAAAPAPAATAPAPAPAATAPASYVSQAAQRIKLGLSGYFQQWGVYANQDIGDTPGQGAGGTGNKIKTVPFDNKHNSEICVIGSTTLDNGLTVGVNVQLEANSDNDQIDESYLFLQGPSFGQIIIGDENNAGYLLHVTAPDGGVSLDSGDLCNIDAWVNTGINSYFDTAVCTTNLRFLDNDSGKFTYITPRFAGLQAGVSFIPKASPGGDDNSSAYFNNTGFGGQTAGGNPTGSGNANRNRYKNGWAGGINYTQDFSGVGVQASVGALNMQKGDTGNPGDGSDIFAYNAGAQVGFAGFSVGGAYNNMPNKGARLISGQTLTTTSLMRSQSYTVGAAYEFGPYKVGLDYMSGWGLATKATNKEQRLRQAVASGTWTMGPGIRLVGGVFGYDLDTSNPGQTGFDNKGWGALSGLKLSF